MKQMVLLAVDDKAENLFLIKELVEEHLPDCLVVTTQSPKEGLELALSQEVAAAILDVQMPGMDGIEMCRRLKAESSSAHVPVILVTAHKSDPELRIRGLSAGADEFISKPISNAEMVAKIKVMLRIKRAEDELREANAALARQVAQRTAELGDSQALSTEILQGSSDAIFLKDLNGRYLLANDACLKAMGRSPEDVIGHNDTEILGYDIAKQVAPVDQQVMESGISKTHEETFDLSGVTSTWHTSKSPHRDAEGNIMGIIGIARDITERKRSEERLRDSESRSRAWLENSPICTKMVDLDFNLQYMSASGIKGLGIDDVTQLYGKPYPFDFYPESFRSKMTQNLVRAKETGEIVTQEEPVVDLEGNELCFHSTIVPINDGDGRIDYFIVVSIDTTQRWRAEIALRKSEDRFRSLFENAPLAYQSLDNNGTFLEVNRKWCQQLGYEEEELLGTNFADYLAPEHVSRFLYNFPSFKEAGEISDVEFDFICKDGSRLSIELDGKIGYASDGSFKQTHCVMKDITQERQAERRHSLVLQTALDGFWIVDASGNILEVNVSYCQMIGYTEDELLSMSIADIEAIESPEEVAAHIQENIDCGYAHFETKHRRKDGIIIDVEINSTYSTESGGLFFVFTRDISERKRVADALLKQQAFLRKAQEIGAIGTWELDIAKNELLWTDENYKIFGIPIGTELTYELFLDCIHPDDRDYVDTKWKAAFNREPYDIEHRLLVDGKIKWVREKAELEFDEKGKCIRGTGVTQDISYRKSAEQDKRQSEERYRQLFSMVPDSIILLDTESRQVVNVNDSALELYGYNREEFLSLYQNDLTAEPDKTDAAIAQVVSGEITDIPLRYHRKKDGTVFPTEFSATTFVDDGRNILTAVIRDVSERTRAEEALREAHEQLRASVDNMPIAYILWAPDLRVLEWNRSAQSIFGYSRDEVLGKHAADMIVPEHAREQVAEVLRNLQAGQIASYSEKDNNIRKDGTLISCQWHNCALKDSHGHVIEIVSMAEDITERKQVEVDLKRSQKKYFDLFNKTQDGFAILKGTGEILEPNPAFLKMVGYSIEELESITFWDLTPEKWINLEKTIHAKALLERGYTDLYEKEYMRKDGTVFPIQVRAFLLNNATKVEDAELAAFVRDITEFKEASRERERLMAAIEQTGDAIIVSDPNGIIQYVNPAHEAVSGYFSGETIGKTTDLFQSEKNDREFYLSIRKQVLNGSVWRGRLTRRKKDDTEYEAETTVSPVFDASGKVTNLVSVSRDITREAELEGRLRQAQKMEAIGTLAGGIAHDFNNILYGILGFNEIAMDKLSENDKLLPLLSEVDSGARRGAELVQQILSISRKTEQVRSPILVQPPIKEALKLLRGALPSTIEMHSSVGECGPVLLDPTELHQIVMNLCTNAGHALRENGGSLNVTLDTTNLDVDGADIRHLPPQARHGLVGHDNVEFTRLLFKHRQSLDGIRETFNLIS